MKLKHKIKHFSLLLSLFIIDGYFGLAHSKDYFNPNALTDLDGLNIADLSELERFSVPGSQLPGNYRVSVILNDEKLGLKDVNFVLDDEQLEPVLTKKMLTNWGIKTNAIPELKNLDDNAEIINLAKYIEFSTVKFIFSSQELRITVPQIAINSKLRGQIDPSLYEQGIPAFTLNYDVSGSRTSYKNGGHQDSQFLSLRSGFNLGPWRLRNYSTYQHSDTNSKWNSINSYIERDVQSIKAQLSLGEISSTGEIFNGFQFKGVKLSSDESMLPYGMRGFAPIVRGFAQGNATVTIKQNGAMIYQTYVSSGPFVIDDLYPSSYSGNLEVTVEEENGNNQSFTVPFSSLAIMQREGGIKYSVTGGKYRSYYSGSRELEFVESTIIYGLPWNTTIYGGSILSDSYKSYLLGFGFDLGDFGGLSFDVNNATTKFDFDNQNQTGQAYRLQYSKTLQQTNSTISFDISRYSSTGFYDFSDANEKTSLDYDAKKRSIYRANLSQSLGSYGNLYLSAYQKDYWQSSNKERNITAGYNIVSNGITYGLSYGYNSYKSSSNSNSHQIAFRVNIPLGEWLSGRNYLTSSVSSSGKGNTNTQVGISGNALNNNLTYSVQQNYSQKDSNLGGNAYVGYKGSDGYVNLGYSYTQNSERFNYGVSGGVVAHQYGVTLSQPLGDTIAVIAAPGASDVPIVNAQGVKTNMWGYAVKPYLTSYNQNNITLDMNELGDNVDILNNSVTVIPTKGAVVLAKIDTRVGYRVLMTLTFDGKPLPFGTVVTLADSQNSSIVGDNGQVYFDGMPEKGELTAELSKNTGIVADGGQVYFGGMPEEGVLIAKWGNNESQMCSVKYKLPKESLDSPVKIISANCIQ